MRRSQRRVLEGALVASVASGAPSFAHALVGGSPAEAVAYGVEATRAIGAIFPRGRPGLIRGAAYHGAISLAVAEILGAVVPARRSWLWGSLGGLTVGVVNLVVIAPRWFPELAAFDIRSQLADNVAFGLIWSAVADRDLPAGPGRESR